MSADGTSQGRWLLCPHYRTKPFRTPAVVFAAAIVTAIVAAVVLAHGACGCCCGGCCACRLCNRAGVYRSKELWEEAVGTCGLSCQLPRRVDFFTEKPVEVGDEILRRTLFYDVPDLPRQVHGFEGSK